MKFFLSGAHNKPSGGAKVINQVANLFNEKGYKAYVVVPDKSYRADFINNPAETIGFNDMVKTCKEEDIVIDCWQSVESWNATKNSKARKKVFWQHGASVPIGRKYTGPKVFDKNTIYTHQWNVSKACKEYIQEKYSVDKIDIVHPFFDTETLKKYSTQRFKYRRNGLLCLTRRGSQYIPKIIRAFGSKTKITVIHGYYREEEFFEELIRHKFFISVDDGVRNRPIKKIKRKILSIIKPEMRDANSWIVPKGHLLGFPMPPAEAARCGAIVIGFAMGGGLEWMDDSNCYLARDRDLESFLFNIKKALSTSEKELTKISAAAFKATNKFNKEHTWGQICSSLDIK